MLKEKNNTIHGNDIAKEISNQTGMKELIIREILALEHDLIVNHLSRGEDVSIRKFVKFTVKKYNEREFVDGISNVKRKIPASYRVRIKPSTFMTNMVKDSETLNQKLEEKK